jgi:type II secretory pathway pseudopilin PulG
MTLWRKHTAGKRSREAAFTLVDALFAMAISGVMFLALYAGLSSGFNVIKMARENTRATQIMLEKMETIRLYTWNQVTNPGFIPTNTWTVPYYAVAGATSGLMYTGRITIAAADVYNGFGSAASYAPNMRKLTVRVDWGNIGGKPRTRTMSTYVTRNGLQNYVP